MNNLNKTWEKLSQDKIKARQKLDRLPLKIAQQKANILQAQLWKPDWKNHQLPGSCWDFEDEQI